MLQPSRHLLLAGLTLTAAAVSLESWPTHKPRPNAPSASARPADMLLKLGSDIPGVLPGKSLHRYRIEEPAGHFLRISVQQEGIDIAVALIGPDGRELIEVDSPTGTTGEERLFFVLRQPGIHRLEVRDGGRQRVAGKYRLRVEALRKAASWDRRRAEAEELFHRARKVQISSPAGAITGFRHAADLFQDLGDFRREADALYAQGSLLSEAERHGQARAPLERSVELFRRAGDRQNEAAACSTLGVSLQELGEEEQAESSFRRALELGVAAKSVKTEATARMNLGKLLLGRGLRTEALAYLEPALPLWAGLAAPVEEARTATAIGTAYTQLGKPRAGVVNFDQALALLKGNHPETRQQRAATLTQKGTALIVLKDFAAASTTLLEALKLRNPTDVDGLANTYVSLGFLAYRRGKPDQALLAYQRALEALDQREEPLLRLAVRINMGWVHGTLGELDQAAALFQEGLETAREMRHPTAEAAALYGLAWLERKRRRPGAAEEKIKAALQVIEAQRAAEKPEVRAAFLGSRQDMYAFLIEILMERHRREPGVGHDRQAFEVNERALGRSLLDGLGPGGLGQPVPLAEIQRLALWGDTLLLAYHLGEDRSYLWAVDGTSLSSYELPGRAEIEDRVDEVRDLLIGSRLPENEQRFRRKGAELSRILLDPVAHRLGERPLRIAPDGALHSLSFGALPDPARAGRPEEYAPLIQRHPVAQIASGSVLAALHRPRSGRPRPTAELALVGNPVCGIEDERLAALPPGRRPTLASGATRLGNLFPPLIYSGEEIREIRAIAGPGTLTFEGFQARRDLILQGRLGPFRIVHFATHGIVDTEEAGKAALVLSRFNERGDPIEGLLEARDIGSLKLTAELVVLSACETGLGERIPGEGLVGLSHSFLATGAPNVVATLWPVQDRSTAELMKRFYWRLFRDHMPAPAALRSAQLSVLGDQDGNSAPYYWAGFVVQGAGASVQHRPPPPLRTPAD